MIIDPIKYTVEHNGKFTTIRTCGGPVGAWAGLTGLKPTNWQYKDEYTTIVNGDIVTQLR